VIKHVSVLTFWQIHNSLESQISPWNRMTNIFLHNSNIMVNVISSFNIATELTKFAYYGNLKSQFKGVLTHSHLRPLIFLSNGQNLCNLGLRWTRVFQIITHENLAIGKDFIL